MVLAVLRLRYGRMHRSGRICTMYASTSWVVLVAYTIACNTVVVYIYYPAQLAELIVPPVKSCLSVCLRALNEHDYYHHDFFVTDFQLLWAFPGHPWTTLGAPVPHTLVLPLPISTDATGRQRDINSHKTIEVFPVYCKETERRWHVKWVSVQCSVTAAAAAAAAAQCRMQLLGRRRDADAHARKRYSAIASILT